MRIICPTCASHYEVDHDKIAAGGQLVRCAQCRDVWLVRRSEPQAQPVPMGAILMAPETQPETVRAPEPARMPIDFQSAKARLRPSLERLDLGSNVRSTLGALALGLMGLGAATAALGSRAAIVRHVPATAGLYAAIGLPVNASGLALRDVRSALEQDGDKTVLTLQGEIANVRNAATDVPMLDLVVRGAEEAPLYTWTATAPKARLARGETVAFRARLTSPPKDGHDVRVSFAEARFTP